MGKLKTQQNDKSVLDFINSLDDDEQKKEAFVILDIFKKVFKEDPKMWGDSIVGFGSQPYKRSNGEEYDWFKLGFSPRKGKFSLYVLNYYSDDKKEEKLLAKLGKYKRGKSCLYIKTLSDVDIEVLEKLIRNAS